MNHEYLALGAVPMTRGSVLRIEDGCDVLIYVWEGELWITQEGDGRDRCLAAGAWFRLDRNGVAVAQATQRSIITLTAPTPELFARRITVGQVELYSAANAKASPGALLARFWTRLFAPHARPTTAGL